MFDVLRIFTSTLTGAGRTSPKGARTTPGPGEPAGPTFLSQFSATANSLADSVTHDRLAVVGLLTDGMQKLVVSLGLARAGDVDQVRARLHDMEKMLPPLLHSGLGKAPAVQEPEPVTMTEPEPPLPPRVSVPRPARPPRRSFSRTTREENPTTLTAPVETAPEPREPEVATREPVKAPPEQAPVSQPNTEPTAQPATPEPVAKKATAKKTTARKTTAKKSTAAKKTTARKAAAKKSTAKKSTAATTQTAASSSTPPEPATPAAAPEPNTPAPEQQQPEQQQQEKPGAAPQAHAVPVVPAPPDTEVTDD